VTQELFINDQEWAKELEVGMDEYMDALTNFYVYNEEEDGEGNPIEAPDTLSGEPFCGCNTCMTREILFYVAPKIMRAQNEKKIELSTSA